MKKSIKKIWRNNINIFLLVTIILYIIYIITKIVISPTEPVNMDNHMMIKSDYILMLIQCLLGLILMMVPTFIEHNRSIDIPDGMEILYFVFLFLAIILGEVQKFYYIIPYWDTILHAFSGCMLGALGFRLVNILNKAEKVKFDLSPFFIAFFAFCFALSAGVVWEIFEYLIDGLLLTNMQKFALENGTLLMGRKALADTMNDLIVDALSVLAVTSLGYYSMRHSLQLDSFLKRKQENKQTKDN